MKSFSLLLFTLFLLSASPLLNSKAQEKKSPTVLRLEAKRKAIEQSIKKIDELLLSATKNSKQQLAQLLLLRNKIKARGNMIQALSAEINATELEIKRLEEKLDTLETNFSERQKSYVASIRALQRGKQAEEQLLFILSAQDFFQGIRRMRYLQEYAFWQKNEAEKLKRLREEISQKKSSLENVRKEKNRLLSSKNEEQRKMKEDEQASQAYLNSLKGKERELKRELQQQKKQAKELNRQIEVQIRKEIEEAARLARANKASKTTRKATSKGGYAMTEKELRLSDDFQANKGRLPAPISTNYHIVNYFGEQQYETLQFVRVNNAGLDLQGDATARALSVFKGVVTRIFTLEGYNNSVILRHGNYLTVYSNLTEVYVHTGQEVSTGQELGKIYQDPDRNGATLLHFQLWKETSKLDPLPWLK